MKEIKLALKMLKENKPDNTKMPNSNLTLKEFLLRLGIKSESYYESLFKGENKL